VRETVCRGELADPAPEPGLVRVNAGESDRVPGGGDSRPVDVSTLDGAHQGDVDELRRTDVAHGGDAGQEGRSSVLHAAQRRIGRVLVQGAVHEVARDRVAEVRVAIDEA